MTAGFAVAISLPLGKLAVRSEPDMSVIEGRNPRPFPGCSLAELRGFKSFATDVDGYFSDRFGFRASLLKLCAFIQVRCLHTSLSSEVVIGKDGWLFYKTPQSFGSDSLSSDSLETWRRALERRQQWLAQRGIKYLFVVVPDKDGMYPEFLPDKMRPAGGRSPVDQLREHMASRSDVPILALRDVLLETKHSSAERLYFRQDSHWNSLGAFVGCQKMIDRLGQWFPDLKPLERSEFRVVPRYTRGDLARMMNAPDFSAGDEATLEPADPANFSKETFSLPGVQQPRERTPFTVKTAHSPTALRAVLWRDSFGAALVPFLPQHFSSTTFISIEDNSVQLEKAIADAILRAQPDVVIEERAERRLLVPPDDTVIFGEPNK